MTEEIYVVALACIALLCFLFFKEIRRVNKSHLFLRLTATLLAVASFAFTILPVQYLKKDIITNQEAVLLTDGFNADSVNNFLRKNGNSLPVIFLNKDLKNIDQYKANYVADVALILQTYKDIHRFHVFGFGLNNDDLKALKKTDIAFHQRLLSSGITAISWKQKAISGETLMIQGRYNNTSSEKARITISNYSQELDSAYLPANCNQPFTLSVIPKHIGRATYLLTAVTSHDTIEKETIAIEVEQGLPLKVIILSSSPDFDTKFLKDFLAQQGDEVAVRTTISKNKFASGYVNLPALSLDHITSSLLDKFTVMIADATALAALPKPELAAIQSQVEHQSLGLVVKVDSAVSSSFFPSSFTLQTHVADSSQQLFTYLMDSTEKLPAITMDNNFSIRNLPNTQPLVFDKQNKIYVSTALVGSGKIVFTSLLNTYTWELSGNENQYHLFWSTLLNKSVVASAANEAWSVFPALPIVNASTEIGLQANDTTVPQAEINGAAVYLKSNPDLPYQWSGIYFPQKEGWQTGIGLTGKPFYWYAYDKNDWQTVFNSEKIKATQRYVTENLPTVKQTEKKVSAKAIEVSKIYFYFLFLLGCGLLWAESKNLF